MRLSRFLTALFVALSLGLLSFGAATAQDATPSGTPGGPTEGYPVAVHSGTCENITAEPAWDVGNATGAGVDDNKVDTIGTQSGSPLLEANGTIDVKLDDLGNEPYVLAVHASADDYNTIVACGQIAGVKKDGKLVISLAPVGQSTVVGVATFDSDKSGVLGLGKDQTKVTAYVFDIASNTPATPAS
ncbi:MAG TPA: hypothetical protein VNZ55_12745 [Thermomicrobiales bacterium]|nr:hypothetical protein [Thermomicrobiales bacterium]